MKPKCKDKLKKFLITIAIFLTALVIIIYSEPKIQLNKRFFPILSLVLFANAACQDTNATTGSCLSSSSCRLLQGNSTSGSCAAGFGVCCTFLQTCGAVLRQNNSYFVNTGYPNTDAMERSCTVKVEKLNDNIVQLRLDFEDLMLNGVTNRACEQDSFQVFGQDANSVVPSVCGSNTGQHVYVDVGTVRGPIMLTTSTSGAGNRRWKVRVTQIERNNPLRAPSGCLRFFTGTTGNVRSFNFNSGIVTGQSNFLRGLNYATCIRRESGYCSIQYTAPVGSFSISGPSTTPSGPVSMDTGCGDSADNLYIPTSRYCGGATATTPFTATTTVAGQFRLNFMTTNVIPAGTYRGFSLDYQQNLCTASNSG